MIVYNLRVCIFLCFIEALYEKKQSMMTYETKTAQLQAQVEDLETTTAEQDTLIGNYEATLVEYEGNTISDEC